MMWSGTYEDLPSVMIYVTLFSFPFAVADDLFNKLVRIIRHVELTFPPGKQCLPLAATKGLGFSGSYELTFILRYDHCVKYIHCVNDISAFGWNALLSL